MRIIRADTLTFNRSLDSSKPRPYRTASISTTPHPGFSSLPVTNSTFPFHSLLAMQVPTDTSELLLAITRRTVNTRLTQPAAVSIFLIPDIIIYLVHISQYSPSSHPTRVP